MDVLIKLTETPSKLNLDISNILNDIIQKTQSLNTLLENTNNMVVNYTSDDLICLNSIDNNRIDNIKYDFIDEIRFFIENLSHIDEENIDNDVMDELNDIIINQELSILRLENLLTPAINKYIKTTKKSLNQYVNTIIEEYNVFDKINNYINKYNSDITKNIKNFMNEIKQNIFPCGNINLYVDTHMNNDINNDINITDITQLETMLKNKYINKYLEIYKNTDNFYIWNNNVILYEFNNKDNVKKIYIYLDINTQNINENIETYNVIDLDISKIFCIHYNSKNINMIKIFNHICYLIDKFINL